MARGARMLGAGRLTSESFSGSLMLPGRVGSGIADKGAPPPDPRTGMIMPAPTEAPQRAQPHASFEEAAAAATAEADAAEAAFAATGSMPPSPIKAFLDSEREHCCRLHVPSGHFEQSFVPSRQRLAMNFHMLQLQSIRNNNDILVSIRSMIRNGDLFSKPAKAISSQERWLMLPA